MRTAIDFIKHNWIKALLVLVVFLILIIFAGLLITYYFSNSKDNNPASVTDESENLAPYSDKLECMSYMKNTLYMDSASSSENFSDTSHNKKMKVYVGQVGDKPSLTVERIDNGQKISEIYGKQYSPPSEELSYFYQPRFSLDDTKVYFIGNYLTTNYDIDELDLKTGKVRFLLIGGPLMVIPSGDYAGDLIVSIHRYFVGPGSYEWYWLIDSKTGEDILPIGEDVKDFYYYEVCGGTGL